MENMIIICISVMRFILVCDDMYMRYAFYCIVVLKDL